MLKQGDSVTLTFDSPTVYQYRCTIHPDMKATLNVVDRVNGIRSGDGYAHIAEVMAIIRRYVGW